jgi:hypothetical protein
MPHYPPPDHPYDYSHEQYSASAYHHYHPSDFAPPPPSPEQREYSENDRCLSPSRYETITDVTDNDILCGRGAPNIHHPGNRFFRSLVKARQQDYAALRRPEKCIVVRQIMDEIEHRGGRFLRQLSSGDWIEVHDAIAYEKTCQALRESQKTRNKSRHAKQRRT